ncbi:MAG: 5-formyltetrahydrofolate cyclo-ligase [Eubacteriales bacterium]|nr:5-formyltetrahydrofolate cyclo-ligase [Eubacteriales bacterium]
MPKPLETEQSVIRQKQALRQQLIASRESLSDTDVSQQSSQTVYHLLSSDLFQQWTSNLQKTADGQPVIALYWAMRQEVDLASAWATLVERGWTLAFPKMITYEGQDNLAFYALRSERDDPPAFIQGRFGVVEPDPNQTTLCTPNVILLPGLAFDLQGNRLGWGKGYYDHYLSSQTNHPITVGVALPMQILDHVPSTNHDYPLEYILTAKGLIATDRQMPNRPPDATSNSHVN